jgi:phenylacetate-CoA ligase
MFDLMQSWTDAASAWDILAVPGAGPAAWLQRCEQRLHRLLGVAARRSKLCAAAPVQRGAALDSLAQWPVMHKAELMRRFDDWVTDPTVRLPALRAFMSEPRRIGQLYDGRLMAWESSGSSGEPGVFVHDLQALRVYDLLESLRRPALWPGAGPLAFVGATDGHYASVCHIERLRRSNPWFAAGMRSFSFMQPVAELVAQLNRYAPTVLATYPSTALMLAEEAVAGRLKLQLTSVWTGGETLTPAVRRFVQTGFGGARVINSYGASEFLALGCECAHGALHLNADWVILEPVDAQHRPVAPGCFGSTTLLTNLANHLQPLIRYDIGDRVRIDPRPCACGSALPVIEVEGRSDDSLVLPDAAGRHVRVPPLALVTVLENDADVFDFQLVQCGDDCIRVDVCQCGEAGRRQLRRARHALGAYLHSQGLDRVRLSGRCGITVHHGPSGKVQRVVVAPSPGATHSGPAIPARPGRPPPHHASRHARHAVD